MTNNILVIIYFSIKQIINFQFLFFYCVFIYSQHYLCMIRFVVSVWIFVGFHSFLPQSANEKSYLQNSWTRYAKCFSAEKNKHTTNAFLSRDNSVIEQIYWHKIPSQYAFCQSVSIYSIYILYYICRGKLVCGNLSKPHIIYEYITDLYNTSYIFIKWLYFNIRPPVYKYFIVGVMFVLTIIN